MVLNYIWVGFFLIAFVVAFIKLIFFQDMEVFPLMLESTFEMAKTGFQISIGLTGVMTLWLGLMKIGERGGMVAIISRLVGPFFSRLFPEIPQGHPAAGSEQGARECAASPVPEQPQVACDGDRHVCHG